MGAIRPKPAAAPVLRTPLQSKDQQELKQAVQSHASDSFERTGGKGPNADLVSSDGGRVDAGLLSDLSKLDI